MNAANADIKSIFGHARSLASPADRAAYVQEACAGDPGLRAEIEALLQADQQAGSFLSEREHDSAATTAPLRERPGTVLGPYKLLEQIGEGGMGLVFVAEQQRPVQRRVALKIIKPGMDSRQVIARFEAERQALALMDHPHIAKVFDGGATPDGRPYFVMELVKGTPITEYCDARRLTTRQRLELFRDVCQAVQHAHQKGIIHRDLKPSNVLVEVHDVRPVVKVIDFGISKAIGQQLTEKTIYTAVAQLVGTPLYMSPEQAGLSSLDVDTRSDVYSLGVLLYELLTGTTPFDSETLKQAGYDEMRRIIREEEPPRPSTRVSTIEQAARSTIAEKRGSEPRRLSVHLRGELDWMVMKSLEKDRNRRYESASAFAADIERYLNDEPVAAGPPSAAYKLKRYARKHGRLLMTATAFVMLLIVSVVISSWAALSATVAEKKALAAVSAEQQANETAQKRLAQIEKANEILASIFKDLNPRDEAAEEKPLQARLGEQLDRATEALTGDAVGDPLAVARLQVLLGNAQLGLGYPEKGLELFVRAKQTQEAQGLDANHPDMLETLNRLVSAYKANGKMDLALPLAKEVFERCKATLGVEHALTLESMDRLAGIYVAAGKFKLGIPLHEEMLRISRATNSSDVVSFMNNLAFSYLRAGQYEKALPLLEESHTLKRAKLGPEHPDTLATKQNIARVYDAMRKWDIGIPMLEETLKIRKARFGPEHPGTVGCMLSLAKALMNSGKSDLACPLFEQTLKFQKSRLGPDHGATLSCANCLALAYREIGKLELAVPLLEETLRQEKATLGPDHPTTLATMNNLASAYHDTERLVEVLQLREEALKRARARFEPVDPRLDGYINNLAIDYHRGGRFKDAEALHQELVERYRKRGASKSERYASALLGLGTVMLKQEKFVEAESVLRESLAIRTDKIPDHWKRFNTLSRLGEALLGQKKYTDAEPLLLQGYDGMMTREASMSVLERRQITGSAEQLVSLYEATNQPEKARAWREKATTRPPQAAAPGGKAPGEKLGGEKPPRRP